MEGSRAGTGTGTRKETRVLTETFSVTDWKKDKKEDWAAAKVAVALRVTILWGWGSSQVSDFECFWTQISCLKMGHIIRRHVFPVFSRFFPALINWCGIGFPRPGPDFLIDVIY